MGQTPNSPWDGFISRCDLDGSNIVTVVGDGQLHTPKQITISRPKNSAPKLYRCDREGMRVMRSNFDGSNVETLIQTGKGDADKADMTRWCVGITVDTDAGWMYWSQKGFPKAGVGRIFRAPLTLKEGESPDKRSDVELLFDKLPEPIDLEIEPESKVLYWTDRGDLPFGNSINSARVGTPAGGEKGAKLELNKVNVLGRKLHEAIGIAVDIEHRRLFFTDLGGSVYSTNLDGSDKRELLADIGDLTGITYVS